MAGLGFSEVLPPEFVQRITGPILALGLFRPFGLAHVFREPGAAAVALSNIPLGHPAAPVFQSGTGCYAFDVLPKVPDRPENVRVIPVPIADLGISWCAGDTLDQRDDFPAQVVWDMQFIPLPQAVQVNVQNSVGAYEYAQRFADHGD